MRSIKQTATQPASLKSHRCDGGGEGRPRVCCAASIGRLQKTCGWAHDDYLYIIICMYTGPTIVGNGKNPSRRRYLDGGSIIETIAASGRRCVCACVCVWSVILTTLTAGARLQLYGARLSSLANGSSSGGDSRMACVCVGRGEGIEIEHVDRRSCESVVRNPKGAIV